jgi:hypothetical protein
MNIIIDVDSADVQAELAMLRDKLGDLTTFVLDVGQLWSDEMAFNFATSPWPPLALSTILDKIAGGYPLAPLVRTQLLRDLAVGGNWQASGSAGSAVAILMLPGYGEYHLDGTRFMPQRDFAFLNADFNARLEDEFIGWLAS